MFDEVGGKIKVLAKVICVIGIIASVITGVVFMTRSHAAALLGLVIMVAGSLCSWVGTFFIYGFGQLIENSDKLVYKTDTLVSRVKNLEANAKTAPLASDLPEL